MRACGCIERAVSAIDEPKHAAWHQLVVEQGGPATGPVDLLAMQALRGMRTDGAQDHKGREKNLRSGKSSPGWRREAAR